jgi:hypothetical protein
MNHPYRAGLLAAVLATLVLPGGESLGIALGVRTRRGAPGKAGRIEVSVDEAAQPCVSARRLTRHDRISPLATPG